MVFWGGCAACILNRWAIFSCLCEKHCKCQDAIIGDVCLQYSTDLTYDIQRYIYADHVAANICCTHPLKTRCAMF